MRFPSGLQTGPPSAPCAVVNRRVSPLAMSVSQRFEVLLFFSTDHSCTTNTTLRPSGERAGALRRFIAQRSCGVSGRFSAAGATAATMTARRNANRRGNFIPAMKAAAGGESKPQARAAQRRDRRRQRLEISCRGAKPLPLVFSARASRCGDRKAGELQGGRTQRWEGLYARHPHRYASHSGDEYCSVRPSTS